MLAAYPCELLLITPAKEQRGSPSTSSTKAQADHTYRDSIRADLGVMLNTCLR